MNRTAIATPHAPTAIVKHLVAEMPPADQATRLKSEIGTSVTEVMTMHESISVLVGLLLEDADVKSFPLLEAVDACLQRMGVSIEKLDSQADMGVGWNAASARERSNA